MAFSFTGDMGCEFGHRRRVSARVGCHGTPRCEVDGGDQAGSIPSRALSATCFTTAAWFKKDRYGLTIGGGQINNPGRYLVLLPPINGETAPSAAINSPYFTGNPGDPFKAWDTSATFDYMPRQCITFRWEYDYRHASVPYWSGAGGITPPPGSNNGFPQFYACNSGNSSGQTSLGAAETSCGGGASSVWFPDLRRDEQFIDISILVKF